MVYKFSILGKNHIKIIKKRLIRIPKNICYKTGWLDGSGFFKKVLIIPHSPTNAHNTSSITKGIKSISTEA